MEASLSQIFGKLNDYKICNGCGVINWYERKECWYCGSKEFDNDERRIRRWIEMEYEYYLNEEGYKEEEIDNIMIEV